MLTQLKSYLLAAAITLSASSLAAPIFYVGDAADFVIVRFNESVTTTVKVTTRDLLDVREQIRVSYGFTNLDALLRVKQIVAPSGITVSLENSSLTRLTRDDESYETDVLALEFEITNNDYSGGNFPVQVVLENVESGANFTVNLIVVAQ